MHGCQMLFHPKTTQDSERAPRHLLRRLEYCEGDPCIEPLWYKNRQLQKQTIDAEFCLLLLYNGAGACSLNSEFVARVQYCKTSFFRSAEISTGSVWGTYSTKTNKTTKGNHIFFYNTNSLTQETGAACTVLCCTVVCAACHFHESAVSAFGRTAVPCGTEEKLARMLYYCSEYRAIFSDHQAPTAYLIMNGNMPYITKVLPVGDCNIFYTGIF